SGNDHPAFSSSVSRVSTAFTYACLLLYIALSCAVVKSICEVLSPHIRLAACWPPLVMYSLALGTTGVAAAGRIVYRAVGTSTYVLRIPPRALPCSSSAIIEPSLYSLRSSRMRSARGGTLPWSTHFNR